MIEQDVLDRIQQLLTFKHSSLYKLAKQSDIPYSSLNNIFNRQTCPTMVTLEKICHGFNISLSEFFSFESNPLRNELLSDDEEELLNTYKELSVQNKKLLKAYLDYIPNESLFIFLFILYFCIFYLYNLYSAISVYILLHALKYHISHRIKCE